MKKPKLRLFFDILSGFAVIGVLILLGWGIGLELSIIPDSIAMIFVLSYLVYWLGLILIAEFHKVKNPWTKSIWLGFVFLFGGLMSFIFYFYKYRIYLTTEKKSLFE